jgi:integrase/recombinase XerD
VVHGLVPTLQTTRLAEKLALLRQKPPAGQNECSSSTISRDVLEAWLRERAVHWPVSTLLHRARIVNRFLDFLVQEGLVASNPVADLRVEYCVKSSKAILRALLTPDPDQALEALRQLPPFGSVLWGLMRNHIALMRTRGFRYETQARWFWRFDRFLQAHPELAGEPLSVMLLHWSAARSTANHAAECERVARALTKAQHHLDPGIELKRPDPRPGQQVAQQWRRPYIYSPEEIRRLLDIARTYPCPRAPLRAISLYTMLVLAYCSGLRLGELARLDLGDVVLQAGTITIRETKFFKSRILPLKRTPAFVAWVGIMRCPASSNSNPVSRWSDLLRTMVRWDHWASDFCRTDSNSARSMIGGCSPGRISFLYLTSPI